jgi:hypothetical protein
VARPRRSSRRSSSWASISRSHRCDVWCVM